MGDPGLQSVRVRVCAAGASRRSDREALLAFLADVTSADPAAVLGGHRCRHCGRTDHGRPWATVHGTAVGVSLARTSGVVAFAVGAVHLGVDVERVSRVAAAPLDAFTPGELARACGDDALLAACWAAKEAVLKRDGRGLRVDPVSVDVDLAAGTATFESAAQLVTVVRLDDDLVLAVAAGGLPVTLDDRRPDDAGAARGPGQGGPS
ncbi:4'-phosphopantetheinyl transferase superfamily protein [Curtobacterium sp. 9128]|uniref:4'-phosphopantetheinyl transferase family protein n=1 Tax=Curtobacterium sp. 9128 TaxID=1793722 RepID=UPI00119F2467|nr:4'-phosphopantetheinyl transferase family protein [Curtobacterium sp. 9128]